MIRFLIAPNTAILACLVAGGCSSVPQTIVEGPTTARPQPAIAAPANGTIFQADGYRPLFEDRRPRRIGDTLTVAINENTTASKAAASSGATSG
ncbi:MAG: flagellar basal body L-ring protein FlgH, partial [Thermoplasmata archaeon]